MSPMAFMLRPRGVGVWDQPAELYRHGNHDHASQARTFLPFIELLLPDDEAWDALFTEEQRLDTFRVVHGNRKGPRPKPERAQTALDLGGAA